MRHVLELGRDPVVGNVSLAQQGVEGIDLGSCETALRACALVRVRKLVGVGRQKTLLVTT